LKNITSVPGCRSHRFPWSWPRRRGLWPSGRGVAVDLPPKDKARMYISNYSYDLNSGPTFLVYGKHFGEFFWRISNCRFDLNSGKWAGANIIFSFCLWQTFCGIFKGLLCYNINVHVITCYNMKWQSSRLKTGDLYPVTLFWGLGQPIMHMKPIPASYETVSAQLVFYLRVKETFLRSQQT
jgi:hypothetical protein